MITLFKWKEICSLQTLKFICTLKAYTNTNSFPSTSISFSYTFLLLPIDETKHNKNKKRNSYWRQAMQYKLVWKNTITTRNKPKYKWYASKNVKLNKQDKRLSMSESIEISDLITPNGYTTTKCQRRSNGGQCNEFIKKKHVKHFWRK